MQGGQCKGDVGQTGKDEAQIVGPLGTDQLSQRVPFDELLQDVQTPVVKCANREHSHDSGVTNVRSNLNLGPGRVDEPLPLLRIVDGAELQDLECRLFQPPRIVNAKDVAESTGAKLLANDVLGLICGSSRHTPCAVCNRRASCPT